MASVKIEAGCPDCGGTIAFRMRDKSEPWNESAEHTAKCDGCGLPLKLRILVNEPERSKREG